MGCSCVSIDETAGFDSRRPVYEYSIARCPCLVGCLWDGSEITRLFAALLAVWLKRDVTAIDNRDKGRVKKPMEVASQLLAAIAVARRHCEFPYLTGAAVVAYGLPIVSQAFPVSLVLFC